MIYYISNYFVLSESKELFLLLLFAAIIILWGYIFVIYFKSHSRTPRINSNQFHITLKDDTEKNSGKGKWMMQSIASQDSLPFVSVIVPVRNEEGHIQKCLLSLLAQDCPRFEVVVIDDDSSDNTLRAIEKIKKMGGRLQYQEIEKRSMMLEDETEEETKLRILSLTDIPEGWAGKTWASEQGYLNSKGSILLFTDVDTHYRRKDVISQALSYMQRQNLDVLTGVPSTGKINDFWSKIVLPLWGVLNVLFGVNNTADVNNPKSKYAYLMGSFFIIKRKVLEDIGTFQSVRGALQEDKALGFRIKELGYNMKIVRLNEISLTGSKENLFGIWYLVGRTVAPLVVKNKIRVVTNLVIIFLVSLIPFVILPFTLFSIVEKQIHFSSLVPPTLEIFFSQPGFDYYYWILLLNIICCFIVIIASALKGVLEYRLSSIYSLLSFFGASFLTVAFAYNILPLLLFRKARPIIWQGRKYIYGKEQEGFIIMLDKKREAGLNF